MSSDGSASSKRRHAREEIAGDVSRAVVHADRHLALRSARPAGHRAASIAGCKARGEFIQGPQIAEFEARLRRRLGRGTAIAASYGRMAFYYMLKALDLPAGSEIILPALTFWVVPELARVAGLKVGLRRRRSGDVHARSGGVRAGDHSDDPRGRADASLRPAVRHGRDHGDRGAARPACHRRLRARARRDLQRPAGRHVRRRAALFSFQTLKPLNCYGGGLALVRDAGAGARGCATLARARAVARREAHRRTAADRTPAAHLHPAGRVHRSARFPILWVVVADRRQPRRLPLGKDPSARSAARGLHRALSQRAGGDRRWPALDALDEWTAAHAGPCARHGRALGGMPGVAMPSCPPGRTHVYYQVLRLRAASATSWSCAACAAASTSRRCTWTSAATWSCSPGPDRAAGRAGRAPRRRRDADSGLLDADRRAGPPRGESGPRCAARFDPMGQSNTQNTMSTEESVLASLRE